jgi:hypothetical protein
MEGILVSRERIVNQEKVSWRRKSVAICLFSVGDTEDDKFVLGLGIDDSIVTDTETVTWSVGEFFDI